MPKTVIKAAIVYLVIASIIQPAHAQRTKIYACGPNQRSPEIEVLQDIHWKIRTAEMSTGGYRYIDAAFNLSVLPDGKVADISIVKTSGRDDIDRATIELIKQAIPSVTSYPKNLGTLSFRITFDPQVRLGDPRFNSDFKVRQEPPKQKQETNSKPKADSKKKLRNDAFAQEGQYQSLADSVPLE